jgi:hypothetical protein
MFIQCPGGGPTVKMPVDTADFQDSVSDTADTAGLFDADSFADLLCEELPIPVMYRPGD